MEISSNVILCHQCGKLASGLYVCRSCGKVFCDEHAHMLALSFDPSTANTIYACEQCIESKSLRVIDNDHPYYMKGLKNGY